MIGPEWRPMFMSTWLPLGALVQFRSLEYWESPVVLVVDEKCAGWEETGGLPRSYEVLDGDETTWLHCNPVLGDGEDFQWAITFGDIWMSVDEFRIVALGAQ